MIKWIERKREAYNTGYSQAVSHPSTNPARQGLTSVIGREPVYSLWYGRRQVICRENLLFYKGKVKKRSEEPPCGFVLLPLTQMPCSAGGCGCLLSVRPPVRPSTVQVDHRCVRRPRFQVGFVDSLLGTDYNQTTISRNQETSSTPSAASMLWHRFSAFWLRHLVGWPTFLSLWFCDWLFFLCFWSACPKYLPGGNGVASTLKRFLMASLLFPNSVVAHFPEAIYKTSGSSTVLPHLLDAVDRDNLTTVQFLRGGLVRLTFKDVACCDHLVTQGFVYGDSQVRVLRADSHVRSIHVRDLPSEVPDDDVRAFFGSFGEVLSIRRATFANYPSVYNGNRVVEVALTQDVPYFVSISSYNCRVWYARQPAQCVICREVGHRAPSCPLSGLCRRCCQPGHMARECRRAWGNLHSGTEILSSDVPAKDDDDSPEYVPPTTVSEDSEEECEMASGDEEVAAQVTAPLPPRSTVPVQVAPAPVSTSVPGSCSSPVSVCTTVSVSPVHTVSSVHAPRSSASVSTASKSPVQATPLVSAPGLTASMSPASSPSRFPEKLAKLVQSCASAYLASTLPGSLLQYSDSAIKELARSIIEEYDIKDSRGLDCAVSFLRFSRKKLETKKS